MLVLFLLMPVAVILVSVSLCVIQFNDCVIAISVQNLFPFSFGSPMILQYATVIVINSVIFFTSDQLILQDLKHISVHDASFVRSNEISYNNVHTQTL